MLILFRYMHLRLGRIALQHDEGQQDNPSLPKKEKNLNFFKTLIKTSDNYKETSRAFRRTVFTDQDWKDFRYVYLYNFPIKQSSSIRDGCSRC